jgi:hypothetical protein
MVLMLRVAVLPEPEKPSKSWLSVSARASNLGSAIMLIAKSIIKKQRSNAMRSLKVHTHNGAPASGGFLRFPIIDANTVNTGDDTLLIVP